MAAQSRSVADFDEKSVRNLPLDREVDIVRVACADLRIGLIREGFREGRADHNGRCHSGDGRNYTGTVYTDAVRGGGIADVRAGSIAQRAATINGLRSEEHTSELQSL